MLTPGIVAVVFTAWIAIAIAGAASALLRGDASSRIITLA
jgi:hypothetical protein